MTAAALQSPELDFTSGGKVLEFADFSCSKKIYFLTLKKDKFAVSINPKLCLLVVFLQSGNLDFRNWKVPINSNKPIMMYVHLS